jgi:hypothetical protein
MKPLAYPEMANMLQLVMAQDPNKTKLNPMAASEGARAYAGGANYKANPHPKGTPAHKKWKDEFWDAQVQKLRSEPSK